MTLMTPGLTEEECRRYQELLEVKGQYERGSQAPPANGEEEEGQGAEPREELRAPPSLSEHEVALIEEELRHLEFKCRNILRAQKMQQLRERCLKAWMMEEETAAATAAGSHTNAQSSCWSYFSLFLLYRHPVPLFILVCTGSKQGIGSYTLLYLIQVIVSYPIPCRNKF